MHNVQKNCVRILIQINEILGYEMNWAHQGQFDRFWKYHVKAWSYYS